MDLKIFLKKDKSRFRKTGVDKYQTTPYRIVTSILDENICQ